MGNVGGVSLVRVKAFDEGLWHAMMHHLSGIITCQVPSQSYTSHLVFLASSQTYQTFSLGGLVPAGPYITNALCRMIVPLKSLF